MEHYNRKTSKEPFKIIFLTILLVFLTRLATAYDVNGDGRENLVEAIHALQVVSGMIPSNSSIIFQGDSSATSIENGIALIETLDNITDASSSNPYLIKLEPGVYDLGSSSLNMKPFIDVEGSGEKSTTIISSITGHLPNYPTVNGANDSEIRFLRIENTGTGTYSVAFRNYSESSTVSHVTAVASGATYNHAISNYLGAPVYRDVTAFASGSSTANRALYIHSSSPVMVDVTAVASGGTNNYGVYNANDGTPDMISVSSNGVLIRGRQLFIPASDDEVENGTMLLSIGEIISGLNNNSPPDESNKFLIKLDAGIYDLGNERFEMQGYVDLEGSGEGMTTISSSNGSNLKRTSGTILGAYNSEIRDLTVVNTSTDDYAIAIMNYTDNYGSNLKNITAVASGGSNNIGIYYYSIGSENHPSVMTNVTADTTAFANNDNYAIIISFAQLTLNNVTARSVKEENLGYNGYGVLVSGNDNTSVRINSSHLIGYPAIIGDVSGGDPFVILSGTYVDGYITTWGRMYCYGSYSSSSPIGNCGGNL